MKKQLNSPALNTLSLAVQSALLLMFALPQLALADDDEVADLIRITPTNPWRNGTPPPCCRCCAAWA